MNQLSQAPNDSQRKGGCMQTKASQAIKDKGVRRPGTQTQVAAECEQDRVQEEEQQVQRTYTPGSSGESREGPGSTGSLLWRAQRGGEQRVPAMYP